MKLGDRSGKIWIGILAASLCIVSVLGTYPLSGALADHEEGGTRDISEITWVQTSDVDFSGGALDGVRIDGGGSGASLTLGFNHTGEWIQKTPTLSPSPRRGHSLSTVYGDDKVVLFGGFDDTNYLNDTWVYDLSEDTWTALVPEGSVPPGRHSHTMAGLPGTDEIVLFGGALTSGYDNVTWLYDLSDNIWRVVATQNQPSARVYHAMASVPQEGGSPTDERAVLFGGYQATGYVNDTWALNSSNEWEPRSPQIGPSPRKGHEMATVSGTDRIVLFGGNESGLISLSDTWIYDVSDDTWSLAVPAGGIPSARRGHGMGSIQDTDEVLLFGPDNQTWIYSPGKNDWRMKALATSPSERYISHGIASIDGTDQLLLFGGGFLSSVWTNYNDTWVYDASSFNGSGTYISTPYDTSSFPEFTNLQWVADMPLGTNIEFQIRTAGTYEDLMNEAFLGPDGSTTTKYTTSGQALCFCHRRDRFLQFRIQLSTINTQYTPSIHSVSIAYLPIDTDGDGIADFDDFDDDGDGMQDSWEVHYGFDPLDAADSISDSDNDGLRNHQESYSNSEPFDGDTDDDGLGDGYEVLISRTDPNDYDTDGDGMGDGLAFIQVQGYTGSMARLPDGRVGVTFAWKDHVVQLRTNSDILEGYYDKGSQVISFKVSGIDGTQGVTELDIPRDMCAPGQIVVLLDSMPVDYSLTSIATGCHVRIEYTHSTHELVVNLGLASVGGGEGAPWNVYIMALVASLVIIAVLSARVVRGRSEDEDRQIGELSPEQLSLLLEKKRAGGELTDETYKDIKSVLEKKR